MKQPIDDHVILNHLGSLPEPQLPERLFERVRSAVLQSAVPEPGHRYLQRRRRVLAWALASAASLGALGVLALRPGDPVLPTPPVSAAPLAVDPSPIIAEIRALDRRLQARIAEGARTEELDELWRQRRLLSSRLDTVSTGINPIRI